MATSGASHSFFAGGRLILAEAHDPVPAPDEWTSGRTYAYTRERSLPIPDDVGALEVRIGLYSQADGRRLPLAGRSAGRREYSVGSVRLVVSETFEPSRAGLNRDARSLGLRVHHLAVVRADEAAPLAFSVLDARRLS
jgi:hypothetical protein